MGFEEFVRWTTQLLGFSYSGERVILAVDAPFGFPHAFRALLNGTPATHWRASGQISNPYAYRQTDRVIHQRFKTPLSASFDKLGNNATVAMHCLAAWREESRLQVLPFDESDADEPVAIEVYPALIRTSATGARPDWYRLIAPDWVDTTGDASDAVVCAALAMAWACPGQWGLPMLASPPADLP